MEWLWSRYICVACQFTVILSNHIEDQSHRSKVHCYMWENISQEEKHFWLCMLNTRYREAHTRTHTHLFNGPLSGTTQVSRYQTGKTNLDFTEARDSEWQWYQLGHMQVCNSLQTDNHARTPPLSFLQAGCPSCHPTNSVKALKACALKAWSAKTQSRICDYVKVAGTFLMCQFFVLKWSVWPQLAVFLI